MKLGRRKLFESLAALGVALGARPSRSQKPLRRPPSYGPQCCMCGFDKGALKPWGPGIIRGEMLRCIDARGCQARMLNMLAEARPRHYQRLNPDIFVDKDGTIWRARSDG